MVVMLAWVQGIRHHRHVSEIDLFESQSRERVCENGFLKSRTTSLARVDCSLHQVYTPTKLVPRTGEGVHRRNRLSQGGETNCRLYHWDRANHFWEQMGRNLVLPEPFRFQAVNLGIFVAWVQAQVRYLCSESYSLGTPNCCCRNSICVGAVKQHRNRPFFEEMNDSRASKIPRQVVDQLMKFYPFAY